MKAPKLPEAPLMQNTGQVVDAKPADEAPADFYEPTENEKELISFVQDHTDRWRDYRDQNYLEDWQKYERAFRGQWVENDKTRQSERCRIVSPATQQAIETRHSEIMEAIFGQGEFFDIKDDLNDENGTKIDVEKLKNQLYEDFAQDKVRKSIEQIGLMAEIYGIGIGEVVVSNEKTYQPHRMPISQTQSAYGVKEGERVAVKLNPINPKNFLFDPNGTSIDDCMGVAIEKYVSIHKIAAGIADGTYNRVDIDTLYESDDLEETQEVVQFKDDKVLLLTYYGLVPREYLKAGDDEESTTENEMPESAIGDYEDMVEAIVVLGNGLLLKAVESPYMMKDRPVLSYQADTLPNRVVGRGTAEKATNMQSAIDGQIRTHMDSLALTASPMMGMDATRLPRGAKFEVKPGKNFLVNGNPSEILFPFKFGETDPTVMMTGKEFERMLLMATGTMDSQGMVSQGSRDADGLSPAVAGIIKKYKRTLVNFQEDFLIPFIYKASWRYMQFAPERYPAVDVTFIPTATLGIIAREYEQKQLAFLIQTLGDKSPLTPILMEGILGNSSLPNKEAMIEQMRKANQPDPQAQQMTQMQAMKQMQLVDEQIGLTSAQKQKALADAYNATVEAQLMPDEIKAKMLSALSNNLNENAEDKDFAKRVEMTKLLLQKKDIESNERIASIQAMTKITPQRFTGT